MTERSNPFYVRRNENARYVGGFSFTPLCEKCDYVGPDVSKPDLAKMLLKRHTETRQHKVNMASPSRFTV